MTVAEMIEWLKTMPQDSRVYVADWPDAKTMSPVDSKKCKQIDNGLCLFGVRSRA